MAEDTITVELKTVQGPCLRLMVESFKDLVNEIDLAFDEQGLVLSNMDGTHMAMVRAMIKAEGVEVYRCRQHVAVTACVAHLHKMIKNISHRDTLTLRLDSAVPHALVIIIENHEKQTRSEGMLKLLDTQSGTLDLPTSSYDAKVSMPSATFQRMCKDMSQISGTLGITVCHEPKEGVVLRGEGEIGSLSHFLASCGEKNLSLTWASAEAVGTFTQCFILKYLLMFTKATQIAPSVALLLTRNFPLLVSYEIIGLGEVTFCLVPKN